MPTYLDNLAEWVRQRESTTRKQDKNLVAFLAIKDDVRLAIEAGYSLRTIWEHLHECGKIAYRYETFLRHVHRHIKGSMVARQKGGTAPAPSAREVEQAPVAPKPKPETPASPRKPEATGFTFNPVPNPSELV